MNPKIEIQSLIDEVLPYACFRASVYFETETQAIEEFQLTFDSSQRQFCVGIITELGMFSLGEFRFESDDMTETIDQLQFWRPGLKTFFETLRVFVSQTAKAQSWSELKVGEVLYQKTLKVFQDMLASCPLPSSGKELKPEAWRRECLKNRMIKHLHGGADGINVWNKVVRYASLIPDWPILDLHSADLRNVWLPGNFQNSKFDCANLERAIFKNANFSGATFRGANLKDANASWTVATDADFTEADLSAADLSHARLTDSNFKMANLAKANLTWVKAQNCLFIVTSMREVSMGAAILTGAQFDKCDLTGAVFRDADLRGVDLSSCTVTNANFKDAIYDENTSFPYNFQAQFLMSWKGEGQDPYVQKVEDIIAKPNVKDSDDLVHQMRFHFERERIEKAIQMLRKQKFTLLSRITQDGLVGIVKSQSDEKLFYGCSLRSDRTYYCATQNLRNCGGLKGSPCKHLLLLVIGLARTGTLDSGLALKLILGARTAKPVLDKDEVAYLLLEAGKSEVGELDWRPVETVPEDFYAF